MSEKKPFLSERTPGRMIDIYQGDDIQHIFAEGTARVMLGVEITKIELTRSLGPTLENDVEVDRRETFATLAVPSTAMVELCTIVLEQYAKSSALIADANKQNANALKEAFKRVAAIKI